MLNTKQAGQWPACFLDTSMYLFVDTKEKSPFMQEMSQSTLLKTIWRPLFTFEM